MRETLGWVFTIAVGALLSAQLARQMTESWGRVALGEPVPEMVAEVLTEHDPNESPIVQAFAEAVESREDRAA